MGLPHARGGVSIIDGGDIIVVQSSPRPWGCFRSDFDSLNPTAVFPTPVGVFLNYSPFTAFFTCLPHARGGVSLSFFLSFIVH